MGSLGYIFYKASRRYLDLLSDSYHGNYPPENVLEYCTLNKGTRLVVAPLQLLSTKILMPTTVDDIYFLHYP